MKLTYDAILNDPGLLHRTLADARRERAEAMHRLIIVPIRALFTLEYALHPGSAHVQGRPAKG